VLGGIFYGFSVHFKIYPIIYSVPFYLFIDANIDLIKKGQKFKAITTNFFTKNRLIFAFVSAITFFSLTGLFYYIYGYEFLYETYLYHLIRKDNRHNFSVYWSLIYYTYDSPSTLFTSLLAFIPQWTLVTLTGAYFYYDLYFTLVL
jgi:phosphatidylinositol glycan class M